MRKRRKILVVEDEPTIAGGLKDLFQSEGYTVMLASDGKSGLEKAVTSSPDILLLDVNLPVLTGFEVCRRARAGGYRNPIIMLSARTEAVDRVLGLEAGADDYVMKPFHAQEILARVRAHLRVIERVRPSTRRAPRTAPVGEGPRRLRAVMFTDMKDFSKKMNENEENALAVLRAHNRLITSDVKKSGGKIVEIVGDAFMVSFPSALQAVACGTTILRHLREYNRRRPPAGQIILRIGIHLGDVIEEGERLRGDTVNIAARLQQMCPPSAITLSGSVIEAVRGRIECAVTKLGKRRVKNIQQPVMVYRVSF